jgi:adenosyl cobinamide kinase/adenosyl cobinamide phosphate guanylyltransferase
MFHVVTGGSGSGKSSFAEEIICRYHQDEKSDNSKLVYIATMIPYGKEALEKIQNHRIMRENKGFSTIECYTGLEHLTESGEILYSGHQEKNSVLLECLSNLTANEMYEPDGARSQTVEKILSGIRCLRRSCKHLVIVTNEICSESMKDTKEMKKYKRCLSEINRTLAKEADLVTEVVYGMGITVKNNLSIHSGDEGGLVEEETITEEKTLKMVIGGAFQGKRAFAETLYGKLQWADGADCSQHDIFTCEGILHFETYVRRMMSEENFLDDLPMNLSLKNPGLVIITDEIGYGLVPVDKFERKYREKNGRICTRLASHAVRVDRVVCGIGTILKGE